MSELSQTESLGRSSNPRRRCRGISTLRRTGARPSFALPRQSPQSSILRQAARMHSGPSSTASRRFFSRAGRRSGRARRCRERRRDRACSSSAASSPTACSRHCNFCPWNCRVDRVAGAKFGACKLASGSRVSSHFHHTGEELFYRGTQGSGTIFFTSCNMRCAFCQNGDISTDKDNGEETDPRTLAAMAWTLRREGCHNINWVGGEVVIHLHAIVDAIALLGRDFTPTQAELARARRTKADRFFWFDELPDAAVYDGKFNAPMLWNSNFFMTLESMKILRVLTDVWLPDFKFGPGRCAMTLAKTPWYWETVTQKHRAARRVGRGFFHPPPGDAQSRRVLHVSGAGMDCRACAGGAGERDGAVPSRQFLRSGERQVPGQIRGDRPPSDARGA